MDKQKSFCMLEHSCEVGEEELKRINKLALKELSADEVFCFNVVLCDNEVDRDLECFSAESLESLAKLFVGVSGIFDHSMKSSDQAARIFDAEVVYDPSRKTADGRAYAFVKAHCYMLRTQKNADLIADIVGGIKKEVSVGCAVKSCVCSICGSDVYSSRCEHVAGKHYNGRLCFNILEQPTDAYEWSFVAVPAQRQAGVTKSFGDSYISKARLAELERAEQTAALFKRELENDVVALAAFALPELDTVMFKGLCRDFSAETLLSFKQAFEFARPKTSLCTLQDRSDNSKFMI